MAFSGTFDVGDALRRSMGFIDGDFNKDDASVTIVTMSQGRGNIFQLMAERFFAQARYFITRTGNYGLLMYKNK